MSKAGEQQAPVEEEDGNEERRRSDMTREGESRQAGGWLNVESATRAGGVRVGCRE